MGSPFQSWRAGIVLESLDHVVANVERPSVESCAHQLPPSAHGTLVAVRFDDRDHGVDEIRPAGASQPRHGMLLSAEGLDITLPKNERLHTPEPLAAAEPVAGQVVDVHGSRHTLPPLSRGRWVRVGVLAARH